MGRRNRSGVRKERIIMLASSVLVLTALTVTGVFVKRSNKAEREDYVVDFETIEKGSDVVTENLMPGEELDTLFAEVGTDDLDYDPSFQEANSQNEENTDDKLLAGQKKDEGKTDVNKADVYKKEDSQEEDTESAKKAEDEKNKESAQDKKDDKKDVTEQAKKKDEDEEEEGMFDETVDTAQGIEETQTAEAISTTVQPTLDFKEEDGLVWPIVGDVLINYSMDKTIYFPTLQQYKYNPAIVIAATQGSNIAAAANGRVTTVGYDPIIGNMVVMDLGNGYELTYGQLENITVSEGSYISVGDGIGTVASPTKYFSLEGTNVYFKLTKDGEPVNPMGQLN